VILTAAADVALSVVVNMGSLSLAETFGPSPLSVPAVDLLTYTFEDGKEYDKTKVRI
jgi:hypothetical protein